MHALTAAHRTLPFNTLVDVENMDNGRRVTVRINDRGPFVRGRIIDLSRAGAEAIGMIGPGTANVRLRVVGEAPGRGGKERYVVQAGAFREEIHARELQQELHDRYPKARVESGGGWHRVQIGPFSKMKDASEIARDLKRSGISAVVKQTV